MSLSIYMKTLAENRILIMHSSFVYDRLILNELYIRGALLERLIRFHYVMIPFSHSPEYHEILRLENT